MCCLDLPGGRNGGELEDDASVDFGVGVKRLAEFSEDYAGRCGPSRALAPMFSWQSGTIVAVLFFVHIVAQCGPGD